MSKSKFNAKDLQQFVGAHPHVFEAASRFADQFGAVPRFPFERAMFDEQGNGACQVEFTKDGEVFDKVDAFVTFAFNEQGSGLDEAQFVDPARFSSKELVKLFFRHAFPHSHGRKSA